MKPVILLFSALVALPVFADDETPVTFKDRVSFAKEAEEDERFHPYPSQVLREAGHHLARTMRNCWRLSSRKDPKPFALVADIHSDGRPHDVAVQPVHAASRCFAAGFSSIRYLPPPEYPGREGFPVMMRIGGGR